MADMDHQIIQLYTVLTGLLSILSIVMYITCAFVVFVKGRSSPERTLIGLGAVLQAIAVVISLGGNALQQIGQQFSSVQTTFLLYGVSGLLSFVGTAIGLWGAVKLLIRAGQMELLLQDQDDDR